VEGVIPDPELGSLTEERRRMRHQIAAGLRRARGTVSQPEFRRLMAAHLGRELSVNQYSRYENAKADPPACVLVAAARAAEISVARVFGEPDRATLQQRIEALEDRVAALEDR
jgi:transcriptional regulator with XRE-family HTH domain